MRLFDQLLHAEPFATTFRARERDCVLVEGQPPYQPRDLAGLYLYGMLNRPRSSRQLEPACWNRLAVIRLMQGRHGDQATIAGFVGRHERVAATRPRVVGSNAINMKPIANGCGPG